ncbi:MAG TPA: PAS domain S-box protein [Kofleriaceae bacterium]
MAPFTTHLDDADKASLFDALERAATRMGLALFVVHVDGTPPTVVYASELLGEFLGRPPSELTGVRPWELVAPSEQTRVRDVIASRGPGASPLVMECEIERPEGTRRQVEVGVARIATKDAELAVCYFRDTTDEREMVVALRRSEARFRSLIELAPDGVVILERGRIVLANPVAVRMFGVGSFEEVRDRSLAEFLPAADAARAKERMAQVQSGVDQGASDYRVLGSDLVVEVHSVPCEYDGKPAILAFVRDATERRRMQDQLLRADRLAALGTMAATVAHEINNPLTYLQLNLQQLEIEAGREPDPARAAMLRELIASALHGVHRVARIVRDLRVYSRDDVDEAEHPVDIITIVERALKMVDHDLRHRAQLIRHFPDRPAIVDAIEGRLEQVIVNLLVNAIQSLDGNDPSGDRITVKIDIDPAHITLAIADTGRGIAEPERIFEPYFTTKGIGEGTGLGLSVCKQIVERMRGRIEVESTLHKGTKITIVLPTATKAHSRPVAKSTPNVDHVRARILVIDDEPHFRASMQTLLGFDHEVDTAADGIGALRKLHDTRYDVILCDLMMPRMNGRDVFAQVARGWPGLERRIVFVTGGAFVPALARFLESVDNLKLAKPFTVEQVLAVVREARSRE